jgi:Zn-dependent protease with chaperone function
MAALEEVFPPSPQSVPAGLTAPSRAYRRHAWIATLGLLAFVTLYLGLTGYFAWVVNRLLVNAVLHHGNVAGAFFMSLPALFFLAFLVRGLFVVKRTKDPATVEITAEQEPLLFAFLHRLAAEAGAPRPHRVYLSARVNACVFYDLSFWNLIVPSKKNLEVGLGLVNVLTLDELKAVLAHEYGHFAQRTMAVGRWVYISQQIAGHVIVSRGIFDRFLGGLSRTDFRIAWVGWVMRLFVWAVRAVLDTGYRLVVIAHRALSREMELQADRVAVAVSGSDSLVHALHRLGPSDEAWDEALQFAASEASQGRKIDDLFALQTASLEHLRKVFAEPDYGKTPARPQGTEPSHRVFDVKLAQPPRMWSTHPPNRDREDNAKAQYVPSALDARDAWALFQNPGGVRASVTAALLAKVPLGKTQPAQGTVLERFAKKYERPSLDARYHGAYLWRSIAAHHASAKAMMGAGPSGPPGDERETAASTPFAAPGVTGHAGLAALAASSTRQAATLWPGRESVLGRLRELYPPTLRADLKTYRERREEEVLLEGLADGVLTAPGGVIRYRGREIRRKELPGVIATVRDDRLGIEQRLLEHDLRCRAAHLDAARLISDGWPEHHEHLVALLHFTTHQLRSISDAHSYLHHVLSIVLADGSVSSAERKRLLEVATDVANVLGRAWAAKNQLQLPADVAEAFERDGGWGALGEKLGLGLPTPQNLGKWLEAVDGWANGACGDLKVLSDAVLDRLLLVEALLAKAVETGEALGPAPAKGALPAKYDTCLLGKERARQKRLGWWDRFQTADGVVPGTARAAVAGALLLPAMFVGTQVGSSTLHIMNGLDTPVVVAVGDAVRQVGARTATSLDLDPKSGLHVVTKTTQGKLVEQFDVDVGGGLSHLAYNVAAAAPLVHWTAVYGPTSQPPEKQLGARRWLDVDEDVVFTEPPHTVSTSRGESAVRTVLEAEVKEDPFQQVQLLKDPAEAAAMIAAHVRFDAANADHFGIWLALAQKDPALKPLIDERATAEPASVILARMQLDAAGSDAEREKICAQVKQRLGDGADAEYLTVRCMASGEDRDAAFERAYAKYPKSGWLAFSVAGELGRRGQWKESLAAWKTVLRTSELKPFAGYAALEEERTLRASGGARSTGSGVPGSGALGFELRVEGPARKDDWAEALAYRALNQGKLAEAERVIPGGAPHERLLALAAASDGANADLVKRALALEAEEDTAPALAGLAIRQGTSPGPYLAKARLPKDLLAELETPSAKKLDAMAKELPLRTRGQLLTLGLVAFGDKAPAAWRDQVKALLFPSERPYFR